MNADQIRVLKIEGHVNVVLGYIKQFDSYEEFVSNEPTCSAAVLHLLQIGELATGLSESFRHNHQNIQWRGIIGLRNIIAHRYGDLNYKRIWDILTTEIPEMAKWLATRAIW
jgi:uncharacterized protein with HEPN domain